MKIVHEDGHVTYYYYKKKTGRHKKPGRKKKYYKKVKEKKNIIWPYKILLFDNKKQSGYIGKYYSLTEVAKKKEEIEKENRNVIFPVKFINNKRKENKFVDYDSCYLVLKRNDTGENKSTYLQNEYGRFEENRLSTDDWIILERIEHKREETFWVYGYNPKRDRKTYSWIIENLINKFINDTYDIIQVLIYNNKVIFKRDFDEIDFVTCKNISDAIRLYNKIEEDFNKSKQVIMTGFTRRVNDRAKDIVKLIQNKTGWTLNKIHKVDTLR